MEPPCFGAFGIVEFFRRRFSEMLTAQVKIQRVDARSAIHDAVDAATSLVSSWRRNGQVVGEWKIAVKKEAISAYVSVLERSSLGRKFENEYVKKALANLPHVGLGKPRIEILGRDPEAAQVCSCNIRESFILFTTFLQIGSPLRCGLCFGMIPLYRIPSTKNPEYYDIFSWEERYRAFDTLYMQSGAGERFSERQLEGFQSPLSREGRELCSSIEKVTGTPTFYYICKFRSRSTRMERERKCPRCNHSWLLDEAWHGLFDFRCESCRLLSNVAFDHR